MDNYQNWKMKTLLSGTLLGALCGAVAASIIIQQAVKDKTQPKLNTGDGVKLGVGILNFIRLASDIFHK